MKRDQWDEEEKSREGTRGGKRGGKESRRGEEN